MFLTIFGLLYKIVRDKYIIIIFFELCQMSVTVNFLTFFSWSKFFYNKFDSTEKKLFVYEKKSKQKLLWLILKLCMNQVKGKNEVHDKSFYKY